MFKWTQISHINFLNRLKMATTDKVVQILNYFKEEKKNNHTSLEMKDLPWGWLFWIMSTKVVWKS